MSQRKVVSSYDIHIPTKDIDSACVTGVLMGMVVSKSRNARRPCLHMDITGGQSTGPAPRKINALKHCVSVPLWPTQEAMQ
jgi:hypothetical protein